jgi:hypothetical protein
MTTALSSLGGTAAAEAHEVALDPTHGLPGDSVTVDVTTETTEPDPESTDNEPLPRATGSPTCEAYWDGYPEPVASSECDVDRNGNISWSGSFTVPEDAAEGEYEVEVRYGLTEAGTVLGSATFTVDAPVVTTTSPDPGPTATGEPTESTDDPTSEAADTSSDETISTTNADANVGGGPPGIVMIMAALALIAAGILSWIIRGLRQRSPKWVSQHVRVVAATGPPQIIERGPRRRPATSVRLEIHRDEPRQEGPTP